jgi:hypothetical protein
MPVTSVKVSFGLYALAIKQDSTFSSSVIQPFSKLEDLRTDNVTSKPYKTWEPNFWLLDGYYKFLPDDLSLVHVGMISTAMSDQSGLFATPPTLTADFSQVHSVDNGLTLHFSPYTDDYCGHFRVVFYDDTYTSICTDDYYPGTAEFSTGKPVSDFKRVVITFYTTNKGSRYLRLRGIDFGELIIFEGEDIKTASVIEDTDMLGAELRANTFHVELFSNAEEFRIIAPGGNYASLLQNQPVSVFSIVDEEEIFIGQYYLDRWENTSETEVTFDCVDLLGVISAMKYMGGIWTGSGTTLSALLTAMLDPVSIPYELDPTLDSVAVIGWLPICTYREALQQVALACGAYIDTSRDRVLKIKPVHLVGNSSSYDFTLTTEQMGLNRSLTLKPLVTGVEVTAHNFYAGSESKTLYNGTLPIGDHLITFSQPMHTLSPTGATVLSSGPNHAILHVTVQGTVTLTGLSYVDTQRVYSEYTAGLDPSIKPNIVKIVKAYLVNPNNAQTVTGRVYDYLQQRYVQRVQLIAPTVIPGDTVLVDTLYGGQLRVSVESIEASLTGGFTAEASLVGVEHVA